MGMSVMIDDPVSLGESIWCAEIHPQTIFALSRPRTSVGATSIIHIPGVDAPNPDATRLKFDPQQARVLNVGTSSRAVIIFDAPTQEPADANQILQGVLGPRVQEDSAKLNNELEALPPQLALAVQELVAKVRSSYPGYFQRTGAGRYVYRPRNFWALKVQPRDASVVFTVYGRPPRLTAPKAIQLSPDQNSYSRFKVRELSQMPDALLVVEKAASIKPA